MSLSCACGSADWFACAPGTAADATLYRGKPVADPPDEPVAAAPMRVWCLACWLAAHQWKSAA